MGFTQKDVESFHRFAVEKLSDDGVDLSLEECVRLWRAEREEAETIASVRRGEQDIEAGRQHTLEEVDVEIRKRFGQAPRKRTP